MSNSNFLAGYELTDRQLQIAKLISAGKSNPEIAAQLKIALNTVKVHVTALYKALGVSSRNELMTLVSNDVIGLSTADMVDNSHNMQILVTVYVPSTANIDGQLSEREHSDRLDAVALFFSQLAGGATVSGTGAGSWVSDDGQLVKEPVAKVETLIDYAKLDEIFTQVEVWRDLWSQACIMVTASPTIGYFI